MKNPTRATFFAWQLLCSLALGLLCFQPGQAQMSDSLAREDSLRIAQAHAAGLAFMKSQQWDSAVAQFQRAVFLQAKSPQAHAYLFEHAYLAYALGQNGQIERFAEYESALRPFLSEPDSLVPQLRLYLGNAYLQRGEWAKALHRFETAVTEIQTRYPQLSSLLPQLAFNQGLVYEQTAQYEPAYAFYDQAFQAYRRQQPPPTFSLIQTCFRRGKMARHLGHIVQARQAFVQARGFIQPLPAKHQARRRSWLQLLHQEWGELYVEQGALDSARAQFRKVLRHSDPTQDHWGLALQSIGETHSVEGHVQAALDTLNLALGQRLSLYPGRDPQTGLVYYLLGETHRKNRDPVSALLNFQQALKQFNLEAIQADSLPMASLPRVRPTQDLIRCLWATAHAHYENHLFGGDTQAPRQALHTYHLAARLTDSLTILPLSAHEVIALAEESIPVYEQAMDLAFAAYQQHKLAEYIEIAFEFSERCKALRARAHWKEAQARLGSEIPDSLLVQERSLQLQYEALYKQWLAAADSSSRQHLSRACYTLAEKRKQLIAGWEQRYPQYVQWKYTRRALTLSALQSLASQETGVVNYYWGANRLFRFSFGPDRLAMQALPLRQPWVDSLYQFLSMLHKGEVGASIQEFVQRGYGLYQNLMDSSARPGHWIIVPDGPLWALPFESLIIRRQSPTQPTYLIQQSTVRYLDAAFLQAQEQVSPTRRAQTFFGGFAPHIPEATTEAQAEQALLASLAQRWRGEAWIGPSATRAQLLRQGEAYRLLWIGPGMVQADTSVSAILATREVARMSLHAGLVLLHNQYQDYGPEAQASMALVRHAFALAGCPQVMMRRWSGEPEFTEDLMNAFIASLKAGMPKAAALRQAQLDYLAETEHTHPYYWANWMLMSDDQALTNPRPIWSFWVLGLGLALSIMMLVYLLRRRRSGH